MRGLRRRRGKAKCIESKAPTKATTSSKQSDVEDPEVAAKSTMKMEVSESPSTPKSKAIAAVDETKKTPAFTCGGRTSMDDFEADMLKQSLYDIEMEEQLPSFDESMDYLIAFLTA